MGVKKPIYGQLAVLKLCQIAAYDARLKPTAIRILNIWAGYADQKGECFPAVKKVAADMGVSRAAITKQIEILERHGYLRREKRFSADGGRRSNIIVLNIAIAIQNYDRPNLYAKGYATPKVAGDETISGCEGVQPLEITCPETSGGCTKKTTEENIIKIPFLRKSAAYANSWEDRKREEAAQGWYSEDEKLFKATLERFQRGKTVRQLLDFEAALKPRLKGLSFKEKRLATMKAMEEAEDA